MHTATTNPSQVYRTCGHPGAPHRHGTRVAYQADGCRCHRCRSANRLAGRARTRAIAMSVWTPLVLAQPVRQHLQHLRESGVGIDSMVARSAVSRSTVRRLLTPVETTSPVNPQRVRADVAQRLFALSGDAQAGRSLVDASPTRHLIDELLRAGHSIDELAAHLRRSVRSLRRTMGRSAVTAHTAEAVLRLHHQLAQSEVATAPPVAALPSARRRSSTVRRSA